MWCYMWIVFVCFRRVFYTRAHTHTLRQGRYTGDAGEVRASSVNARALSRGNPCRSRFGFCHCDHVPTRRRKNKKRRRLPVLKSDRRRLRNTKSSLGGERPRTLRPFAPVVFHFPNDTGSTYIVNVSTRSVCSCPRARLLTACVRYCTRTCLCTVSVRLLRNVCERKKIKFIFNKNGNA